MKIGNTNASSFRLGTATPSKVYLGSTQVWSDAPPAPPNAIATVTAATSTTAQSAIDLSWTAPADNGSAITGYNVYRSTDGGTTFTLVGNTANTTYEYVEAYRGGQSRSFNVRAVNAGGEGPNASAYGSANLSDSPPSAPTGLTATALAGYDLRVEFSAPTFTGNQSITDYEIGYQRPASSESFALTGGVTQNTFDFTSMESGYAYDVRVRAVNSVGNGEWTSVVTSPAVGDVPSASPSVSPSSSSVNQGAVTLSIEVPNANGSAITSYDVQWDINDSFSTPLGTQNYTDQPGSGTFNREITGLAGGVTHYFRVRFVNAIGNGSWSSSGSAAASSAPPGQVTAFSASPNYSQGKWDFNWTAPATGGSEITGYEIQEADSDAFSSPDTYSTPASPTAHQETAYDQNLTRYFRIRAINAIGNGAWSAAVSSSYNTLIALGIGSGGSGGSGDNNGASGGQTTLSFEGMSLTANGGSGGAGGSGGSGGSATGGMGSSTSSGGSGGAGGTGDTGGGGGGAINGNNGYDTGYGPSPGFQNGAGGTGALSSDFNGLFSRLASLEIPSTGAGAGDGGNDPSAPGGNATGFGCGGGAAGYYGNVGGNGLYGGGGGGAASEGESRTGGAGGAGCVILEFVTSSGTTQHIVTTGSSYTAPSNATTIKAWVVGGGGGGGGASSGRGASGGGGAGGIAYYEWTR